jgi:putative transcriptional regulator
VSSGSPEELILRPDREDIAVIAAVMAIAKRGLSMLKAKRAIETMMADGKVIVEVPMVENTEALAVDLLSAGIRATFRSVDDRLLMADLPGRMQKLRSRLKLSQEDFARVYAFDVKTIRGWEAGKMPDRGNRHLIRMIERDPVTTERLVNEG